MPDDDENVIARRFAEQRRQQRREAPFTGITAPADVRQERRPWWDPLAVFWVAPNVEPTTPNRSRGYQLRQVTKQPSVRKGCGSRCCASLKRCFGRGERYERTASGRQQKPTSVPSRARAMSFSEEPSAQIEVKLANVFLLGNAAPNNARKGIVGWFPLVPKDVGGAKLTGELKLRFHLKRAHLLEGLDEACRQELIAHPAAYIRVLNRHTSYEPAAW